jgi:hypothetical protein
MAVWLTGHEGTRWPPGRYLDLGLASYVLIGHGGGGGRAHGWDLDLGQDVGYWVKFLLEPSGDKHDDVSLTSRSSARSNAHGSTIQMETK